MTLYIKTKKQLKFSNKLAKSLQFNKNCFFCDLRNLSFINGLKNQTDWAN